MKKDLPTRSLVLVTVLTTLAGCTTTGSSRQARAGAGALTSQSAITALPTTSGAGDAAGTGSGDAGSLTVALSEPVSISGHVDTTVDCTAGRAYRATAGPAVIDGTTVSVTVVAADYSTPGAYSAVVTAAVTPTGSEGVSIAGIPGVPVTISATGGSVELSVTGTSGRAISGSISWACS
ncbi:MAG: hypothetical protein L6311_06035 [Cellulomonas sp.]|nr:hypothetical protein [Cellulomonas sp.]